VDVEDALSIGERARKIRRRRGLSLEVVAGLAGITAQYLSMLERGLRGFNQYRPPRLTTVACRQHWNCSNLLRTKIGPDEATGSVRCVAGHHIIWRDDHVHAEVMLDFG
jgi:hypothetical protein